MDLSDSWIRSYIRFDAWQDPDPTAYALAGAMRMLRDAFSQLDSIPHGTSAASDEGALYIYWRKGDKQLQFTYPATPAKEPYLYARRGNIRTGSASELWRPVTVEQLVERLQWLQQ